jgi:hypothetical protein
MYALRPGFWAHPNENLNNFLHRIKWDTPNIMETNSDLKKNILTFFFINRTIKRTAYAFIN